SCDSLALHSFPTRRSSDLRMKRGFVPAALLFALIPACARESRTALIARAKSLELSTPYVPPPGDPLAHHAAALAKIICSAVFIRSEEHTSELQSPCNLVCR